MKTKNLTKLNLQTEINLKLVLIAELKQMVIQCGGILSNSQNTLFESGVYSLSKIDDGIKKRKAQLEREELIVADLEKQLARLGPDAFE